MLMAGKQITQVNDPLTKIQPDYLYHAIRNPKPQHESAIRQLRQVRALDENRYRQLKKQLPYVVCGIFNPPVRRTENFAWIDHFMVDIDHLSGKEIDAGSLRDKLCADSRVKLLFASPGEDGLKILFQLSEKCHDPGLYSFFYKLFVRNLSQQYRLEQVIDTRTSDVARACFISVDENAYYNDQCTPVTLSHFVDLENPFAMHQLKGEIKKEEKESSEVSSDPETGPIDPDDEALRQIKARLNPNARIKKEKIIHESEEVAEQVGSIVETMQNYNIETTDVQSIHYGKKFRFRLGRKQAEINLFYGKRGYTVVKTPKQGTDNEMGDLCAQILNEMLS